MNFNHRFIVVCIIALCAAEFASAQFFIPVPGPDASDQWMRQQLFDMSTNTGSWSPSSGSESDGTLFGEDAVRLMDFFDDIKNEEWREALDKLERYYEATRNSSLEADVNRASNLLTASMLAWNVGRTSAAREFAERAIDKMRHGEHLGGGCEVRAVRYLQKMRSGDLPRMFTSNDILAEGGIHEYIMELPQARFNKTLSALNARYAAIGGMADAQRGIYEAEGRFQERRAKFYARQEYQNNTGRRFDPDDPPARGTSARDHWDSAKRIYDIFGE